MTSATSRQASRARLPMALELTIRYRLPFLRVFEPVVGSVTTIASDELDSRSSSETSPYLSASREAIPGSLARAEGTPGRTDHDTQLYQVNPFGQLREGGQQLQLAQSQLLGDDVVRGADDERRRLHGQQLRRPACGGQMLLDQPLPSGHLTRQAELALDSDLGGDLWQHLANAAHRALRHVRVFAMPPRVSRPGL